MKRKEFVPASSSDDDTHDIEGLAERRARLDRLVQLRNTYPGNRHTRKAVLRLGVGAYMQEPPRFEAPQLDPKIRGSVRDVLAASAAAAHEASLKSSEERGPEWSRRREEMERNQTVIERIPSAHPTRKHELSILTVNFGNMLRSGQTPHSAEHCNTLLAKFLLGDHSQIVLVQESTSLQQGIDERRFHLQDFQKLIQSEPASDLSIIVSERLCTTQRHVLESKALKPFGGKRTSLHYLIACIDFKNSSTGESFEYAGQSTWKVCSFHFNNIKAKQTDVAKASYDEMFGDCVKHGVLFAGGDANMSLELGTLRMSLDNVLSQFPNVKSAIHCYDDDCMVGVVFHYDKSTLKRVRMAKAAYENHDFRLRPGDADSHRPLKVHFSDGGRDRSEAAHMFRDHDNRQRERARKCSKTGDAPAGSGASSSKSQGL